MSESWPPTLEHLKLDMNIKPADDRDDDRLQMVLDAAIAYVEGRKKDSFNFDAADLTSDLPEPDADLRLGTLRLASRWHTRRSSPDLLIQMGAEMGVSRVPSFDVDIDRLLRIGRYAPPAFA